MKKILIVIFLLSHLLSMGQYKIALIFEGESNSGGFANNSDATPTEISSRSIIQILNNGTFGYENLHIGVNNLLLHQGFESTYLTTHGWELELANRVAAGDLQNPTYLIKTGQGGSNIFQWPAAQASHFWDTATRRIDTALFQLSGTIHKYLFWSQGINDKLAGSNVAIWKDSTKAHFAKFRARYGFVPIFITKFESVTSIDMAPYNTAIDEIASEMTDVYAISSTGATMKDEYHWNYAGMKLVADRMIDSLIIHYEGGSPPVPPSSGNKTILL